MGRRPPLDPDDAALWGRVVETVVPLPGRVRPPAPAARRAVVQRAPTRAPAPVAKPAKTRADTLDGTWDRRLARGAAAPDRSVDLHGETLARAHAMIEAALAAAVREGERVVLLVTGKVRADARFGRGAIRALAPDWLRHSRHAGMIAAVRPAHPRHGGAGALYVILRRR